MRMMYQTLPPYLQARVVNGTKGEMFGTQDFAHLANNSEVHALPSTEQAGRSEAVSWLIMDEAAQQRLAGKIWGAAQQTIATGGRATIVSTAYGFGNFFHKTYTEALMGGINGLKPGVNGFVPHLVHWQDHPDSWYGITSSWRRWGSGGWHRRLTATSWNPDGQYLTPRRYVR